MEKIEAIGLFEDEIHEMSLILKNNNTTQSIRLADIIKIISKKLRFYLFLINIILPEQHELALSLKLPPINNLSDK